MYGFSRNLLYDCTGLVSATCIRGHVNHAGQERAKVNQLVGGTDKDKLDLLANSLPRNHVLIFNFIILAISRVNQ